MFKHHSLMLVAIFVSVVSLIMSAMALWPGSRKVITTIRDVLLWGALIFVVFQFVQSRPTNNDYPPQRNSEVNSGMNSTLHQSPY